jgi:hypothetical protein
MFRDGAANFQDSSPESENQNWGAIRIFGALLQITEKSGVSLRMTKPRFARRHDL